MSTMPYRFKVLCASLASLSEDSYEGVMNHLTDYIYGDVCSKGDTFIVYNLLRPLRQVSVEEFEAAAACNNIADLPDVPPLRLLASTPEDTYHRSCILDFISSTLAVIGGYRITSCFDIPESCGLDPELNVIGIIGDRDAAPDRDDLIRRLTTAGFGSGITDRVRNAPTDAIIPFALSRAFDTVIETDQARIRVFLSNTMSM